MWRLGRLAGRTAAILTLVALLVVPLALGGHQHTHQATSSRACAICIAAHHSPGVTTPGLVAGTMLVAAIAPPATPVLVAPRPGRSSQAGRAPPPSYSSKRA